MAEFSSLNGYAVKDTIARNIAKGRNQALAYSDYATMIETLNEMDNDQFKVGQNIYIGTVGVPDLWVYSIEPIVHTFNYVDDETTVELLKNNVTIQCGYYKLAMLEGQKVDLTETNTKLEEHDIAISEQNKNIVKFTEISLASVAVTTKSSGGAYYFQGDFVKNYANKNINMVTSVLLIQWTGAVASFSVYVQGGKLCVMSDVPQTIATLTIRVGYL